MTTILTCYPKTTLCLTSLFENVIAADDDLQQTHYAVETLIDWNREIDWRYYPVEAAPCYEIRYRNEFLVFSSQQPVEVFCLFPRYF